jgi:hypothetical protein
MSTNGGTTSTPSGGDLEQRLLDAFSSIANKQGGADAAGVLLLQENKAYRQEINKLKADLAAAQGKLPGEGAVILDGEQAAAWSAYQELGKPDELKQLRGEYTQLQRNQLFQQAAAAHGYKAAVLGQLPGVGELSIEVREVEQDGKKNQVAFVKNGDGQERPLPDYVKDTWSDFIPALTAEQKSQASGTPWPKQDVSSQGADTSVTNSYLERQRKARESRKNPITGE